MTGLSGVLGAVAEGEDVLLGDEGESAAAAPLLNCTAVGSNLGMTGMAGMGMAGIEREAAVDLFAASSCSFLVNSSSLTRFGTLNMCFGSDGRLRDFLDGLFTC